MSGNFRLKITTDPSWELVAKSLRGAGSRFQDFRPVLKEVIPIMAASVRANISAQSGPDWGQWPKPSAAYKKRKVAAGYGAQPLHRTGALKAAATSQGAVLGMSNYSVVLGVRVDQYPQALLNFPRKNPTPRRAYQFMGWTPTHQRATEKRFEDYINATISDLTRSIG